MRCYLGKSCKDFVTFGEKFTLLFCCSWNVLVILVTILKDCIRRHLGKSFCDIWEDVLFIILLFMNVLEMLVTILKDFIARYGVTSVKAFVTSGKTFSLLFCCSWNVLVILVTILKDCIVRYDVTSAKAFVTSKKTFSLLFCCSWTFWECLSLFKKLHF